MINENLLSALEKGDRIWFLREFGQAPCTEATLIALADMFDNDYHKKLQIFAWAKFSLNQSRSEDQRHALLNFNGLLLPGENFYPFPASSLLLMEAAEKHDWENVLELWNNRFVNKNAAPPFFLLRHAVESILDGATSPHYSAVVDVLQELFKIPGLIEDLSFKETDLLLKLCEEEFLPEPLRQLLISLTTLYGVPLISFATAEDLKKFALEPAKFLHDQDASFSAQMAVVFLKAQAKAAQIEENIQKESPLFKAWYILQLMGHSVGQKVVESMSRDFFQCLATQFTREIEKCESVAACDFLYESLIHLTRKNALYILNDDKDYSCNLFNDERARCYHAFVEKLKQTYLPHLVPSSCSLQKKAFYEAAVYDLSRWQVIIEPIYKQHRAVRASLKRPFVPFWGYLSSSMGNMALSLVQGVPLLSNRYAADEMTVDPSKKEEESNSSERSPKKQRTSSSSSHSPS